MTTTPRTVPPLDTASELAAIRPAIDAAIARVLDSGHYVLGPEVEAFEAEAASFLGTRHAVALNSGTDALLIALRALGVGPGDEVVTTPFSFFATSEVVLLLGATPVFVDVDPSNLTLDPERVASALTDRTKAILPVHLYGDAAPVAALVELADRAGIPVVEDAAQAFGATVDTASGPRALGTIGRVGAFSFYPTKNLGALGDGGLLTTDDDAVATTARALRNHGGVRRYEHQTVGYNSRLDALQAAVLRAKLPLLRTWTETRRSLAARYDRALASLPGVRTPVPSAAHVYHQYTIRLDPDRRDGVVQRLRDEGVGAMVYYPATLDAYGGRVHGSIDHARAASRSVVSLPIYPTLGDDRLDRVASALVTALEARDP